MPRGKEYRPNVRENNIKQISVGSANKTGKSTENRGATFADVSANDRKWQPKSKKSGNTFKAKPGA